MSNIFGNILNKIFLGFDIFFDFLEKKRSSDVFGKIGKIIYRLFMIFFLAFLLLIVFGLFLGDSKSNKVDNDKILSSNLEVNRNNDSSVMIENNKNMENNQSLVEKYNLKESGVDNKKKDLNISEKIIISKINNCNNIIKELSFLEGNVSLPDLVKDYYHLYGKNYGLPRTIEVYGIIKNNSSECPAENIKIRVLLIKDKVVMQEVLFDLENIYIPPGKTSEFYEQFEIYKSLFLDPEVKSSLQLVSYEE